MPYHQNFDRMDALSLEGEPFFFMVDFLMVNVEIFSPNEISEKGLLIDFQDFKAIESKHTNFISFEWKAYPESFESYQKGFDEIKKELRAGNSYLANYTRKTPIETNLSLEEIFALTKAKYKVYYPGKFVFFSPETFVEIIDDKIFAHPMKGTIEASVPNAAVVLKNDIKEKAEHYTVVDLLRNDLSMVADDVKVDEFQRIDTIKTNGKELLAMSSEISGNLKPDFQGRVGSILKYLLPAGSILGAPKRKTQSIVIKSEGYDRGWYTGVCGYFDGKNLDSCVMIRFIEVKHEQKFFKSGGGITHMSTAESEYEEMKNKIYVPIY